MMYTVVSRGGHSMSALSFSLSASLKDICNKNVMLFVEEKNQWTFFKRNKLRWQSHVQKLIKCQGLAGPWAPSGFLHLTGKEPNACRTGRSWPQKCSGKEVRQSWQGGNRGHERLRPSGLSRSTQWKWEACVIWARRFNRVEREYRVMLDFGTIMSGNLKLGD